MADHVRPVNDKQNGKADVVHHAASGADHAGMVTAKVPKRADGTADRSAVILPCPGCAASSWWPLDGGAEPSLAPLLQAIAAAVP